MGRVGLKRLLGAGVVAALAVIVLPFILQGEGYKAALRTDIPDRPEPPEPLDTAQVEPPAEVRELMTPPQPLPIPVPPAEAPVPVPPAEELVPPRPEGAGQEASTPPQPAKAASPKPAAAGQWVVQLGSFGVEANARQLQDQVQGAGIPCQIVALEIEGRRMWRVRAGPFATQAAALAALQRLQGGLKLGGMVMPLR